MWRAKRIWFVRTLFVTCPSSRWPWKTLPTPRCFYLSPSWSYRETLSMWPKSISRRTGSLIKKGYPASFGILGIHRGIQKTPNTHIWNIQFGYQSSRRFFLTFILPVSGWAQVDGGGQGLCWPHELDHELDNIPKLFMCRGCRVFDIFHDPAVSLEIGIAHEHFLYFERCC